MKTGIVQRFKENSLGLSWIFFATLALLSGLLAVVQGRWIEQIGTAERLRMQTALQSSLERLSADFDDRIANACAGMMPTFLAVQSEGTQAACTRQYAGWRKSHDRVFRRVAVVLTGASTPDLSMLDLDTGLFARLEWPAEWRGIRTRIAERAFPGSGNANAPPEETAIAIPLFGSLHRHTAAEIGEGGPPLEDWLILDLSTQYVAQDLLPELMAKHLDSNYAAKLALGGNSGGTVLKIRDGAFQKEDAAVRLLNSARLDRAGSREQRGPERLNVFREPGFPRWQLLIRHTGRSVDDRVTLVRWQNIALSSGILICMLGVVAALFHHSRRANQLASMQMRFVAGVSHDLRTPLTVIRTAAYNLKSRISTQPEQVEKYGELIQQESEKLTALVEKVLRFNAGQSGRVAGERRPISVRALIEDSLQSSLAVPAAKGVTVSCGIDDGLPPISGDPLALKHALQNIFDNAIKYGMEGGNWLGIGARAITKEDATMVEIRVSDHGPGIPIDERRTIFDAFVRGQGALQDHVQGTGLGLNLVKSIVEAHGGRVELMAGAPRGASFLLTLPALATEDYDAFANIAG